MESLQDIQPRRSPSDVTEQAFADHSRELQRFLLRRTRSSHTAHDLAQDVYLRFLMVSRHEPIRNTRAFLYQLAVHVLHEFRMREEHSRVLFDSGLADAHEPTAEADGDTGERLGAVQDLERILLRLPKAYRAVLLLRKRDGLSPQEIADLLGFSKKTVYEYLTRALALIREARLGS